MSYRTICLPGFVPLSRHMTLVVCSNIKCSYALAKLEADLVQAVELLDGLVGVLFTYLSLLSSKSLMLFFKRSPRSIVRTLIYCAFGRVLAVLHSGNRSLACGAERRSVSRADLAYCLNVERLSGRRAAKVKHPSPLITRFHVIRPVSKGVISFRCNRQNKATCSCINTANFCYYYYYHYYYLKDIHSCNEYQLS